VLTATTGKLGKMVQFFYYQLISTDEEEEAFQLFREEAVGTFQSIVNLLGVDTSLAVLSGAIKVN
jgi:hypothetical protein